MGEGEKWEGGPTDFEDEVYTLENSHETHQWRFGR